jgi:hypothetical protein
MNTRDRFLINSSKIIISDPNIETPHSRYNLSLDVLNGYWVGMTYPYDPENEFLPSFIVGHESYGLDGIWEKVHEIRSMGNTIMGAYDLSHFHDLQVVAEHDTDGYSCVDDPWLGMILAKLSDDYEPISCYIPYGYVVVTGNDNIDNYYTIFVQKHRDTVVAIKVQWPRFD